MKCTLPVENTISLTYIVTLYEPWLRYCIEMENAPGGCLSASLSHIFHRAANDAAWLVYRVVMPIHACGMSVCRVKTSYGIKAVGGNWQMAFCSRFSSVWGAQWNASYFKHMACVRIHFHPLKLKEDLWLLAVLHNKQSSTGGFIN